MSQAVHILALISITADKAGPLEEAIRLCAGHSLKEEACKRYEISRDVENEGHFTVSEIWASKSGFETHLGSSHFGALASFIETNEAKLEVISLQPLKPVE